MAAAVTVYSELGGPGLLESVYEEALALELHSRGLRVERQKNIDIRYKGRKLNTTMRIDLLVAHKVIVECKAVATYNTIFEAQALTYLRVSQLRLAYVVNFGQSPIRQGIHRVVNALPESPR